MSGYTGPERRKRERRTIPEAFQCPTCGCLKSRVLPKYPRIQPGDGYVRKRIRRCENGHKYSTTERIDAQQVA